MKEGPRRPKCEAGRQKVEILSLSLSLAEERKAPGFHKMMEEGKMRINAQNNEQGREGMPPIV